MCPSEITLFQNSITNGYSDFTHKLILDLEIMDTIYIHWAGKAL